jgi:hypothetical protein
VILICVSTPCTSLGFNHIGDEGAIAIGDAVRQNKILAELR